MSTATDYFEFHDGLALVRRSFTAKGASFRLMSTGTNGQWVDDESVGLPCFDSAAREVTVSEAKKIAARLGGSLADDGGGVPILPRMAHDGAVVPTASGSTTSGRRWKTPR